MKTSRLVAVVAALALFTVHEIADADALAVTTGYPKHPLSPNAALINRNDCAQPLEHWQFAFSIPVSSTYTDLVVYARSDAGSCAPPSARSGSAPACRRVASFARTAVTSNQVVTIPSAAMLHALVDKVDVDPAATLDREAICYPAADEVPRDFVLSSLLFDGADVALDATGAPFEATTSLKFDRRGPEAPTAVALRPSGTSADVSFSIATPAKDARGVAAYCFPLVDAETGTCAVATGMLHTHELPGLLLEGNVCGNGTSLVTSMHLTGFIPGQPYAIGLVSTDTSGNTGPISPVQCFTASKQPEVLEDTAPSAPPPPINNCSCRLPGSNAPTTSSALSSISSLLMLSLSGLARIGSRFLRTRRARTV